jgi:O-antigen/teichoic acid export membrane protein
MMKVASIARNTTYFTLALIIQKIITFSYFAIMARYLDPEQLGRYYLAISFTTIFAIIIDLGLANVLTRETAKSPSENALAGGKLQERDRLFSAVLLLKVPLALIALFSVFIFSWIFGYSGHLRTLIYISSISMLLDSFSLAFWSYVRGFHILKFESISVAFSQVLVFVLGVWAMERGMGLEILMAIMALSSFLNFSYSLLIVRWRLKARVSLHEGRLAARHIIAITLPFALYAVLQRVYTYLDSLLLSSLASEKDVGLYQIAFKIVFALQFLPMAFTASLYPAFSLYYKNAPDQLRITFERAMNYLLIISLPISVGIIVLADKVMLIFKPEYMDAALPLRVSMLSLVFIFINFPIGSLLNACDQQKKNTRNMAIVLPVSIILNLILIPRLAVLGASLTVLLTNALMVSLGLWQVTRIVSVRASRLLLIFLKIMLAALFMGLFSWYLRERLNIFINIGLSAIIYIGILYPLGAFSKEDVKSILKSLR